MQMARLDENEKCLRACRGCLNVGRQGFLSGSMRNPDVRQQAWEIIQTVLAAIGETPDLFRNQLSPRRGRDLEFVAYAALTEWTAT